MRNIRFLGVLFLWWGALLASSATAQLGAWTAHTSLREVSYIDASGSALWAATSGGVFSYDPASKEITRLTVVEGLHGVVTNTIAFDNRRQSVWVGYIDGVLDRIDAGTGAVRTFRDVERAGRFTTRSINRIVVAGDSLLIATAFGLVVFDPVANEVRDSYTRLGNLAPATPVFDIAVAPLDGGGTGLWLATPEGIAFADVMAPNLQDPSSWTSEALPNPVAQSLAYFDGRLFVGTGTDLFVREPGGTYAPLSLSADGVRDLQVIDGALWGVDPFRLLMVPSSGAGGTYPVTGIQALRSVRLGPDGMLWIGDGSGGLVQVSWPDGPGTSPETLVQLFPEGPFDSQFTDLWVDTEGVLWAGGLIGRSRGFYRLHPSGVWTTFNMSLSPELAGRADYDRVYATAEGTAWAGSDGHGLARVSASDEIATFDETNASLRPVTGFPGFVSVRGISSDEDGLWVTTRGSPFPLHHRSPGGDWTAFGPLVGQGLTSSATAYDRIFTDSFGQKWIIILDERDFRITRGLVVLDTGASPQDADDDEYRYFSQKGGSGQGLPGVEVTSVAEDRDGLIWIGTRQGLAYIVNNGIVALDPSAVPIWPQQIQDGRSSFLLLGLAINDIAIDSADRLWVATQQGVRVIRAVEGGFEEVLQLTTDNSPLLSDNVTSVAVRESTGEVFLATEFGLVSVESNAIAPASGLRDLFVYPNPVRIDDQGGAEVFVEGLVAETDIVIVTGDGIVVRRLDGRGGRVRWDVRDSEARLVSSGIYIVAAVDKNGAGTAYGKVAVIR